MKKIPKCTELELSLLCCRRGLNDGLRGTVKEACDPLAVPGSELPAAGHDDAVGTVTDEQGTLKVECYDLRSRSR